MSKTPNPVRGHVSCPVCHTNSTVHMIGEGKLIDSGETVKNGRNLGLLYYKCPNCGNASMSKSVSAYCTEHMQASPDLLPTAPDKVETAIEPPEKPEISDESELVESTDVTPIEPTPSTEKTADKAPLPENRLQPQFLKVGACLGVALVLLLAVKRMLAADKVNQGETNHE